MAFCADPLHVTLVHTLVEKEGVHIHSYTRVAPPVSVQSDTVSRLAGGRFTDIGICCDN